MKVEATELLEASQNRFRDETVHANAFDKL
jgi:hypothetical protein